jgi:hypothetical protein
MKKWNLFWVLLVVLIAASFAPVLFAAEPTGASPNDPLMVTGNWQTAAPNAPLWFYFDYPGDKSRVLAAVDANGVGNLQLGIYTPEQAKQWLQDATTKPIGNGSPQNSASAASVHDLVWQGAFNMPGRFFAVVTNNNAAPVSFRLLVVGDNVSLAPPPTATPLPSWMKNPYATPVPTGSIQGHLVLQESSGGNIYTVNGDGSNLKRITNGLDPTWSPDGTQIAFSRWSQPGGLFVANADGSNERQVFGANKIIAPQWSPNSTRIAFSTQKGGTLDDKQLCFYGMCFNFPADPHWKMGVVNINTNVSGEPLCTDHCFSPTWNNDNHTIVFADATFGLLTTDADSNANPASKLFTQNPSVQSPSYSPDGTKIAFEVKQNNHRDIVWMNADGNNATPVTSADPLSFTEVNNVAPAWSPDGKQILFLSDRNGKWEYFVVNTDGTGLTQVLKSVSDQIPLRFNFSSERMIDWFK